MTTAFGALAACLLPSRVKYRLYTQELNYTVKESTPGDELILAMLSPARRPGGLTEIAKVSFKHLDQDEAENYQARRQPKVTAYLQYAGVVPAYRNCGLGQPLLEEFRRVLLYSGVERIYGDFHSRRIVRLMNRVFGPMVYAEGGGSGDLRPEEVTQMLPEASPESRVLTKVYPFISGPKSVTIWYDVT